MGVSEYTIYGNDHGFSLRVSLLSSASAAFCHNTLSMVGIKSHANRQMASALADGIGGGNGNELIAAVASHRPKRRFEWQHRECVALFFVPIFVNRTRQKMLSSSSSIGRQRRGHVNCVCVHVLSICSPHREWCEQNDLKLLIYYY